MAVKVQSLKSIKEGVEKWMYHAVSAPTSVV